MTSVLERPTRSLPTHIEPVLLGPTWRRNPETGFFVLPKRTLGWQAIDWARENLTSDETDDEGNFLPWEFTDEQGRFVLWWYAVDEQGRFVYRDGILQRLKGWGKDPLAAVLAVIEMIGPCRYDPVAARKGRVYLDPEGNPHPFARDNPSAWIQIVAVSKTQTKNTMLLFPGLIPKRTMRKYDIKDIGREVIYALGGRRQIQACTSSPSTIEGGRATFIIKNETHLWLSNNSGHDMDAVIERNATKSKGGASRSLAITNAYAPSENSTAQITREAYELELSGDSMDTGILYDSIEAPEEALISPPDWIDLGNDVHREMWISYLKMVVTSIRGDAYWLDLDRILQSIFDRKNPPSRSRRWWFNQITAAEDAWVDPFASDSARDKRVMELRKIDSDMLRVGWSMVKPTDECVMFGDGSKSDDETWLVGCRLSDGYCFTLGRWHKPPGMKKDERWLAPRGEFKERIREIMGNPETGVKARFNMVAFWMDPGHMIDDEDDSRYWDPTIDWVHLTYRDHFQIWAFRSETKSHSVLWDMTGRDRYAQFTTAAETTVEEFETKDDNGLWACPFTYDGFPPLQQQLKNAKRYPTIDGVSLWKGHRESDKKVDGAVCLVGARMLRRITLNRGLDEEKPRGGRAWAA